VRVAEYLWRESGKWAQKQPPEDFGSLKFYGRWGHKEGFRPVLSEAQVSEAAAYEIRRVLRRLQEVKRREDALRGGYRYRHGLGGTRGRDGLTVFGVDGRALAPRLIDWAEQLAVAKMAARSSEDKVTRWRGLPTLRALPEIELPDPNDPDVAYELWLEQEAAAEAALDAAIEAHLAGEFLP
jgi:hypothetical protein